MTAENAFINGLEEALSHGSAERRAKTLGRITDLFVFGFLSSDRVIFPPIILRCLMAYSTISLPISSFLHA
jgi:hypothetical protein